MADERPTDGEVLARGAQSRGLVRLQVVLNVALAAMWTWRAVRTGETMAVVLAVAFVLLLAVWVVLGLRGPGTALVVTPEALHLRRRVRPLVIPRADVVAVRGDVDGRPSWSTRVVVETADRTVPLPELDRSPAVLVPRLQEWAGVDEHARADPPA